MKNVLHSSLLESIKLMYKGQGKSTFLNDILAELKMFTSISSMLNPIIPSVPFTGTISSIACRKPVKLMKIKIRGADSKMGDVKEKAALKISFQTKTLVSNYYIATYQ